MASTEYSGAARRSSDPIFSGLKFLLAADVPQRSYYKERIENHGGVVVKQPDDQTYVIIDHMKKKNQQRTPVANTYSYKFIDASIRDGKVSDDPSLAVAQPVAASRPAGSPNAPRRGVKVPYTKDEDVWLWDYVKEHTVGSNYTEKGNALYQEVERVRPRHTWQSWRDHYIKQLMGRPRPVPLEDADQGQSQALVTSSRRTDASGGVTSSMPGPSTPNKRAAPSSKVDEASPSAVASRKRKRPERANIAPKPVDQVVPNEAISVETLAIEAVPSEVVQIGISPTDITRTDKTATPMANAEVGESSQVRDTSDINTTAEELLFLYEHADDILQLDPDRTEECWQALAQRPGFKSHSAEAWQVIWQELVLPQIIKIRSVYIELPADEAEEEQTARAASEKKAEKASLNKANTKRRLTTVQRNGSVSQSQSQSSNGGEGTSKARHDSSEEPTMDGNPQDTPRPVKRVKTIRKLQDDSREQDSRSQAAGASQSKQSAPGQDVSPRIESTEESLTPSTEESTQDRVDAQIMSSMEFELSEQEPNMESGPNGQFQQTKARDDQGEGAEEDPQRSAEDGISDQTPYLLDAGSSAATRTQTSSQALTTTTPGNTAPVEPYPTSSNKSRASSKQEKSSMHSLIETTQPGFTSPVRASSPPRGRRVSPIRSSGGYSFFLRNSQEKTRSQVSVDITDGERTETAHSTVETDEEGEEDNVGTSQLSQANPRPWIKDKVQQGFAIDLVTTALNAATGYTELAETTLDYLSRYGKLPTKLRGVFTARDDDDLQSQDARRVARVRKKHGPALADMRLNEWLVS